MIKVVAFILISLQFHKAFSFNIFCYQCESDKRDCSDPADGDVVICGDGLSFEC